jgi:hypothetical protein
MRVQQLHHFLYRRIAKQLQGGIGMGGMLPSCQVLRAMMLQFMRLQVLAARGLVRKYAVHWMLQLIMVCCQLSRRWSIARAVQLQLQPPTS